MTSLLRIAALAPALLLPLAAAQAQQQQGSNQAQGYTQSHGAAGAGYRGAYARYGGHRYYRRY